MTDQDVLNQYRTTDLLRIRAETHELHTENPFSLDEECAAVLGLRAGDSHLDVGCGPGMFLRYLRARGHSGRLAGLDQSGAMIAEAAESAVGSRIEWVVGEADALPFADGEFASASARHMLYHVPDIPAALAELGRVAGPEGTILVATNGRRNSPHMADLEADVFAEFGLEPPPFPSDAFSTANAREFLDAAYVEVHETILRNAFVFDDAAPIVRYLMTQMGAQRAADDPRQFAEIHERMTVRAHERLKAMGGVWRDPKEVGLYICRPARSDGNSSGK
jgi:SAM-dependent methyltransferase